MVTDEAVENMNCDSRREIRSRGVGQFRQSA